MARADRPLGVYEPHESLKSLPKTYVPFPEGAKWVDDGLAVFVNRSKAVQKRRNFNLRPDDPKYSHPSTYRVSGRVYE